MPKYVIIDSLALEHSIATKKQDDLSAQEHPNYPTCGLILPNIEGIS